MIDIELDAKSARWRRADPNAYAADRTFADSKEALLRKRVTPRGYLRCEGCTAFTRVALNAKDKGLTPQGYFEVHHISGDHADSRERNLAFLCPYCHSPFHVGFNCASENGCLVYAPEFSQAEISRITFVSAVYYNTSDNEYITSIKQMYHRLTQRRHLIDDVFGQDAGVQVANLILAINRDRRPIGEKRRAALPRLLEPLRYLPYLEESRMAQAMAYWRRAYHGIKPDEEGILDWVERIQAAKEARGSALVQGTA